MAIVPATRQFLLASARAALAEELGLTTEGPARLTADDPCLSQPARVFVSWHAGERLLGCIGTLTPYPRLDDAVRRYAVAAGVEDPRTGAMAPGQLEHAHCEVSVLGEPRDLDLVGLDAIAGALVPGTHGVIVRLGTRRAVFLPVVWDKLPTADVFLDALCRKAGIDPHREGPGVRAQVFDAEVFGEG